MSRCHAETLGLRCMRKPRHKGRHRSEDAAHVYEWGGRILLRISALDGAARDAHVLRETAAAINRKAKREAIA